MSLRLPFSKADAKPTYYKLATNPSRVDNAIDLHKVIALIEMIRFKVQELEAAWQARGAGSVDYRKHIIMSALLKSLDHEIQAFNSRNQKPQLEEELREVLALVEKLMQIVRDTFGDKATCDVLATKRNENREMACTGTNLGLIGGTATVASAVPYSFPYGLFICGLAAGATTAVKKYTGLDNQNTASYCLVRDLDAELEEVKKTILPRVSVVSSFSH